MRIHRLASLIVISAALAAGCNTERPIADGGGGNCVGCHGGLDNQSGAPPYDREGNADSLAVGAHTRHLEAGLTCSDCHVVPTTANAPGHLGPPPGDVTFGPKARLNPYDLPGEPAYDPASRTCSSVYCHGAKLKAPGGTTQTPNWNETATCGSCHGRPPAGTHPQVQGCGNCHEGYTDTSVNAALHINGVVDASISGCTGCHGDESRPGTAFDAAPPIAATDSPRAVGAHQKHLAEATRWAPSTTNACGECHPGFSGAHPDGTTQIAFGGPRGTIGVTPAYDPATGTCSSVYCHGATLGGGPADKSVVWTGGAPEAEGCAACHGFPPPAPAHPANDVSGTPITTGQQCAQCHPTVEVVDGAPRLVAASHVNGLVDVGVHPDDFVQPQKHGQAAMFHDPAWPNGVATCRECHGANLDGVNGVEGAVSCNGCHGAAPINRPGWQTRADGCTFCHGSPRSTPADATRDAAPPVDTQGRATSNQRGVGAHQAHLGARTNPVSNGVPCASCHTSPDYADIAHMDGTVAVAAGAGFSATPGTCANQCHGEGLQGGSNTTPAWTETLACDACHGLPPNTGKLEGAQTMHALHAQSYGCTNCHREVSNTTVGQTQAITPTTDARALHVNGQVNVRFWRSNTITYPTQTWDPTTGSCANVCHGATPRTWR